MDGIFYLFPTTSAIVTTSIWQPGNIVLSHLFQTEMAAKYHTRQHVTENRS